MIEISETMARYLFNGKQKEIYILHSDGSESLVEDINDIIEISSDDCFGMED